MKTSVLSPMFVGVLLFGSGLSLHSLEVEENLVPSGDFEDEYLVREWVRPHQASQTFEEAHTGFASLRFRRSGWATSPEPAEIDQEKSYVLRAFIKEPGEKLHSEYRPLTVSIGLRLFDDKGEEMSPYSVLPVPNTETILARNAAEGDRVIHLEGLPWETIPNTPIGLVFGAEEDFSDLPNQQVAPISKISAGAEGFEVHLSESLDTSHSAGTRVRQHRYADFPQIRVYPGEDWEEHMLEFRGVSEPGLVKKGEFWHGTHQVRPTIGVSIQDDPQRMASEKPIELLVDDVSFFPVD